MGAPHQANTVFWPFAMATETTHDEAMQTPVMRQYFAAKQAHPENRQLTRNHLVKSE